MGVILGAVMGENGSKKKTMWRQVEFTSSWPAAMQITRNLPARRGRRTLGRSVESHTVSTGTQKYRNLNLRKPKFTEIWFKSISACALNPLQWTQLYQYSGAKF
jgi:hypothetical protein